MAERLTPDELLRILGKANSEISFASKWEHMASRRMYRVCRPCSLFEEDLEPLVHYQPIHIPNMIWSRRISSFLEKFRRIS